MINGSDSIFTPTHTDVVAPPDDTNFTRFTFPSGGGPLMLASSAPVRLMQFKLKLTEPWTGGGTLGVKVTLFDEDQGTRQVNY